MASLSSHPHPLPSAGAVQFCPPARLLETGRGEIPCWVFGFLSLQRLFPNVLFRFGAKKKEEEWLRPKISILAMRGETPGWEKQMKTLEAFSLLKLWRFPCMLNAS